MIPAKHNTPSAAPNYLSFLSKTGEVLESSDGKKIEIWELKVPPNAPDLKEWASNFRQHYCLDEEIDELRDGTGLSRADYLTQLVFPDKSLAPGPAVRAGDFAELVVSDYVEYILGYWVPRGKYAEKASRDESVKGVDILGFRLADSTPSNDDKMVAFEVKAQFTGRTYEGRLQKAINDSSKDFLRRAISLNATKRRLLKAGENKRADVVKRFQNPSDHPYIYRSGAAAFLSGPAYNPSGIAASTTCKHQNSKMLELLVIRGHDLMKLVHTIYQKAADEA